MPAAEETPGLVPGGAERSIVTMARFQRQGLEITVHIRLRPSTPIQGERIHQA